MSGAGLFPIQTTAGRLAVALDALHAQSEAAVSLLTGDPPADVVRRRLRVAQAQMTHLRGEVRAISTVAARARCTIPDLAADELVELCEAARLICLLPPDEDRFALVSHSIPPLFVAGRADRLTTTPQITRAWLLESAGEALHLRRWVEQAAEGLGWPAAARLFLVLPADRAASLACRDPA